MRLVLIHGMRQEGLDPLALRSAWEQALTSAWRRDSLAKPAYDLEMPYFGNVLHTLTEQLRGDARIVIARGAGGPSEVDPVEEALIRDLGHRFDITDAEVQAELGQEIVARGPANWEWVQAIARLLEKRVPGFGALGLSFVRQVDAYLTRPHIQLAVDDIVRPALTNGPAVVVAHSLGSIVAYRLLREAGTNASVPLFVTLGSPLGINVVKHHLKPPKLAIPDGVKRWFNGTDERDYVALVGRLRGMAFATNIEDCNTLRNGASDAHSIVDYLGQRQVAAILQAALAAP